MTAHPVQYLSEAADRAIAREHSDILMDYYADEATLILRPGLHAPGRERVRDAFEAIAGHFNRRLDAKPNAHAVRDAGELALLLMEALLDVSGPGKPWRPAGKVSCAVRPAKGDGWSCMISGASGPAYIAVRADPELVAAAA
jgi:ketosteroid isomerase-like protein